MTQEAVHIPYIALLLDLSLLPDFRYFIPIVPWQIDLPVVTKVMGSNLNSMNIVA